MQLLFYFFGVVVFLLLPIKLSAITPQIATSDTHTLALKTDGSLWAWGSNDGGLLGDDSMLDRLRPVQIGSDFTEVAAHWFGAVALKRDGSLWAWGKNLGGLLGDGSSTVAWMKSRIYGDIKPWIPQAPSGYLALVHGMHPYILIPGFNIQGRNSEEYCAVCDIITAQCPLVIARAVFRIMLITRLEVIFSLTLKPISPFQYSSSVFVWYKLNGFKHKGNNLYSYDLN